MRLNLFALSKTERNNRMKFRCPHRHNGITHAGCYDKQNGLEEQIGYYDIETTNLSGDFGCVLSWCILGEDGKLYKRLITPQEIQKGIYDKKVLEDFCITARKFTRLIGYYSSRFDAPFLRTRCIYWNLNFPVYQELKHTDAYMVVKHKLNLHSKRLGVVAPFFKIPAKQHSLNPEIWFKCLGGDKKALKFVLTHNTEDVISLKKLWHRISPYTKLNNTSL